jgi:hypothetical protein
MLCLGMLDYSSSAYTQCQHILKHVSDADANVRHAVLCAILSLVSHSFIEEFPGLYDGIDTEA